MNIDNFTKEELLKYQELLKELKKEQIYQYINYSYATISTILFIYFAREMEFKKMLISALIAVLGYNMISINSKGMKDTKKRILMLEKKDDYDKN